MQVHHIGYLVENMRDALKEFYRLGYELEQDIIFDDRRRVNICFVKNQHTLIELIEPAQDCKLFTKLHKRIGNAPYHICYITRGGGINDELSNLQDAGYFIVQPPEPAAALENRRVAFLMSDAAGLIEILESERSV